MTHRAGAPAPVLLTHTRTFMNIVSILASGQEHAQDSCCGTGFSQCGGCPPAAPDLPHRSDGLCPGVGGPPGLSLFGGIAGGELDITGPASPARILEGLDDHLRVEGGVHQTVSDPPAEIRRLLPSLAMAIGRLSSGSVKIWAFSTV